MGKAKRFYVMISALIIMLTMLAVPFTVSAATETYEDSQGICYTLDTSTGTATVSSYEGNPVTVTIPEKIKNGDVTYTVTAIGTKAFASCKNLESIALPDSVTTMELGAFRDCTRLRYVTLSNNITIIPTSCFNGCIDLTSITIPDKVTRIDGFAFMGCSLVRVTIPENVTFIGTSCFENCRILREVTLPDGLTGIGMNAFQGCEKLQSVTLPSSVDSTGSGVFRNCTSLTTLPLSDGFTEIKNYYCLGCKSLSVVTIPENITKIGENTFTGCTGLETIYIPSGTEVNESAVTSSGPTIPATATQVRYTVDGSGNVTITGITVGSGKSSFQMPTEIAGYPVTSVEIGEHTHISAAATCSNRANCDLCGEEFLGEHRISETYSGDATGHWHVCTVCNERMDEIVPHTETEAATCIKKAVCGICGEEYGEFAAHKQSASYSCDATGHYHTCTECGTKLDSAAHVSNGGVITKQATTKAEGVKTYSCKVCGYKLKTEKIAKKPVKVSKLTIKAPSRKLAAGKKVQLTLTVSPKAASNKSVTWKTSNKKYATVSSTGKVTLKKAGAGKTVTITAIAKDGSGKKATIKIRIMKNSVKSVKLKAPSKTLKAGNRMTLKTTIKTTGKKVNKTLKYTSSNTKYATVNKKGRVVAKKAGKGKIVTITATSTDGSNKKAKVRIRIK